MDLERGNVIAGYAGLTEPSDFNKNILICIPKINEGLTGVQWFNINIIKRREYFLCTKKNKITTYIVMADFKTLLHEASEHYESFVSNQRFGAPKSLCDFSSLAF